MIRRRTDWSTGRKLLGLDRQPFRAPDTTSTPKPAPRRERVPRQALGEQAVRVIRRLSVDSEDGFTAGRAGYKEKTMLTDTELHVKDLPCRTAAQFKDHATAGFTIAPQRIAARRTNARGTLAGWVPGHGGDVWWVKHQDGSIAAYTRDELTAEPS